MTCSFSAMLLFKTGILNDDQWDRLPVPRKLIADPFLAQTSDNPTRFHAIKNMVDSPTMRNDGNAWQGAREKSNVFFQILIEACLSRGDIVADHSASTGASLRASRAS